MLQAAASSSERRRLGGPGRLRPGAHLGHLRLQKQLVLSPERPGPACGPTRPKTVMDRLTVQLCGVREHVVAALLVVLCPCRGGREASTRRCHLCHSSLNWRHVFAGSVCSSAARLCACPADGERVAPLPRDKDREQTGPG